MSSAPQSRLRVFVAYVACCVTWGSTWSVIKIGLEDLPPLRFAGMRMLLAGLVLLPIARPWSGKVPRGDLKMLVQVGLLQICIPFGLMFVGQQWIPSSWAALLFSTFPVWLLLVARMLLPGHALTPLNVVSALLGVAGVAVMQVDQLHAESFGNAAAVGGALILAAAAVSGFANVLARKHLMGVSTAVAVCVQTLVSGVLLFAASVVFERDQPSHWTLQSGAALVYLALGATVATYQLLYWLLPRVPLPAVGAIPLLDTLVAVAIGVAFLGERVTLTMVIGGGLILFGAGLANLLPGSS
ncbi:MAG: EamA family transporter, partial [Myxococcaceae bacterium]